MTVPIQDLLEAGTHFGHQTRRWNPKMQPFIFTERNGIHIIDLNKTVRRLEKAEDVVRRTAQAGKAVLFVGTKKQAVDVIRAEAERCNMFFVTERWLGGMLTNWKTIRQNIRHLDNLDRIAQDGTYEKLKKKEVLLLEKERARMIKTLEGIRKMNGLPGLIYIVDIMKEHGAILEARKLDIPSVAIIDTNCDPDLVEYPIPGNDDAIRAIHIYCELVAGSVLDGIQVEITASGGDVGEGDETPAEALPAEEGEAAVKGKGDDAPAEDDTKKEDAKPAEAATGDAVVTEGKKAQPKPKKPKEAPPQEPAAQEPASETAAATKEKASAKVKAPSAKKAPPSKDKPAAEAAPEDKPAAEATREDKPAAEAAPKDKPAAEAAPEDKPAADTAPEAEADKKET